MARISVVANIVTSGISAYHQIDPINTVGATVSDETAVNTDVTAVNAAVTAAAANATISGDGTAAGLVTAIGTAMTTLGTDYTALKTQLGLISSSAPSVVVSYDPAVVVSRNQLKACFDAIMKLVNGANDLN